MNEYSIDDLSDDELLAVLGRALRSADPVPRVVTEYATASFGLRSIDTELAEMVFDSSVDELVGVRSGSAETREVTFRAPGLEIEVAIVSEEHRRIVGQLIPPQTATVQLRHRGGSQDVETDRLGRFTLEEVPPGPISLRCEIAGGPIVQTDWMIV